MRKKKAICQYDYDILSDLSVELWLNSSDEDPDIIHKPTNQRLIGIGLTLPCQISVFYDFLPGHFNLKLVFFLRSILTSC